MNGKKYLEKHVAIELGLDHFSLDTDYEKLLNSEPRPKEQSFLFLILRIGIDEWRILKS